MSTIMATGSIACQFKQENGFPMQKSHAHTKTRHNNPNNIQKQLFSTSPN